MIFSWQRELLHFRGIALANVKSNISILTMVLGLSVMLDLFFFAYKLVGQLEKLLSLWQIALKIFKKYHSASYLPLKT